VKTRKRTFLITLIIALVVAGGSLGALSVRHKEATGSPFRTVAVKRSDLVAMIGATGTVEPEEVVDVGAQVAGQISSFGKDKNGKPIDYGSVVDEGTVLAQIDDSLYTADVNSAQAAMQQAEANLVSSDANVAQSKAKLDQAQQDWDRAQKLGPSEALAPSAYDQYKANYEVAKATLAVSQAAVDQAKATVAQANAALYRAQRNLGYCTIKSPVKGVIIDRRVNIGQTVVSSLNAPSLFLIAKDLRRVQVWVSVNEADIGNIHPDQPVTFTVDAFPNQTFVGQVGKVRLNAAMTQNVVTYTVEVNTDNPDGKLLPYLTANVHFETGRRQNVLVVPNAALRWSPQPSQVASQFRKGEDSGGALTQTAQSEGSQQGPPQHWGTVWTQEGEFVRPLKVSVGLTDGTMTEVQSQDLTQDLPVVMGEQSQQAANAAGSGTSPFLPQLRRSRPAGSQGGAPPAPGGR